jgi:hypothetical protein
MAITSSGAIRLDADILVELGQGNEDGGGLKAASIGDIDEINTNNAVADRPDGSAPHLMSEFYSYDHSATSAPAQGDYGNSSSTIVWTGNQGSSSNVIEDIFDLSSASLCGASVIGRTCHIYLRLASGNGYRQDAQLKGIRPGSSGSYYAVGGTSADWGWEQWDTTRRTTNTSYNHSSGWYDVTETNTSGRWSKDEYGTPSSSTGIDVGSTGCIYYEGSGSYAYNKHVYLRSKEFTISSNTFIVRTHGYGSNMGTLYFGVYLTD